MTAPFSIGKSTMSRAVTTAFTPGSFSAFEVSIDLMRACGCGLRNTLPQIMPGMVVSAANWARPVTLSMPSGRMVRWPIHLLLVTRFIGLAPAFIARAFRRRFPSPRGRSCHSRCTGRDCRRARSGLPPRSGPDSSCSSASEATSMPEVQMPHCSAAISRNFCCSGCSLSPCAMPSMVRISWSLRFDREHQAGADQPIVERDRAGAAIAGGAAFLGAGERQRSAQRVEHGVDRLAQKFHRLAVDGGGDVNFGHELSTFLWSRVWRRSRRCA